VRFKDVDYARSIVAAAPLPLEQGEIGVITFISKKDPTYVKINNGPELWDWTLFKVI